MDDLIHLNIGSTLQNGKYEIVKVLGQGGFGITYLARHTLLGTLHAVKEFFPSGYCNRDENTSHITVSTRSNVDLVGKLRARFISEARNIAGLNHPGIIKIHDIFEENGTAYYVMDFIEGESLEDMVKRSGALSQAKAVEYITKVAEAIEFIHSQNMTHFDIKPANIMVRQSDDTPIVIDFGLSKQFNREGHAQSTILLGISHGYSPIEQYFEGGITSFSPQTDVYALGATLYYLLTSRTPPESPKLMNNIIEVPEHISPAVASAVKHAMRSDLKDRTPSARALINELNGNATQMSYGAVPPNYNPPVDPRATTIDRRVDFDSHPARNEKAGIPGYVWAIIGVLACALIGVGLYFGLSDRKPESHYIYADDETPSSHSKSEKSAEEVVEVEEVAPYDEAEEEEEVIAVAALDEGNNYYNLSGSVNGYNIVMKMTIKKSGDSCRVSGKYAYKSTLNKYGDQDSSWFFFDGSADSDAYHIYWNEWTSSNPDYQASFDGYFDGSGLKGTINSNNADALTGHLSATTD